MLTCGHDCASGDAETCWYCGADLCSVCWDARGHCGHEAADLINEYGRLTVLGLCVQRGIGELKALPIERLRGDVALARLRLDPRLIDRSPERCEDA